MAERVGVEPTHASRRLVDFESRFSPLVPVKTRCIYVCLRSHTELIPLHLRYSYYYLLYSVDGAESITTVKTQKSAYRTDKLRR